MWFAVRQGSDTMKPDIGKLRKIMEADYKANEVYRANALASWRQ